MTSSLRLASERNHLKSLATVLWSTGLAPRRESWAAFEWRCIPSHCIAPLSNITFSVVGASSAGRLRRYCKDATRGVLLSAALVDPGRRGMIRTDCVDEPIRLLRSEAPGS